MELNKQNHLFNTLRNIFLVSETILIDSEFNILAEPNDKFNK